MFNARNGGPRCLEGVEAHHQPGPYQALIADAKSRGAERSNIWISSLFNVYNRWISATGVPEMSQDAHRQQGKSLASRGYGRE